MCCNQFFGHKIYKITFFLLIHLRILRLYFMNHYRHFHYSTPEWSSVLDEVKSTESLDIEIVVSLTITSDSRNYTENYSYMYMEI